MKLDRKILKYALKEVDHHVMSDLLFAKHLHAFLHDEIALREYLEGESGFKRFLYDYRVGRTLQAGDKAKVNMLKLVKSFSFSTSYVVDITSLAGLFQKKKLSTVSINGKYGYPQSFASKLMSVHRPDVVIPYDSYALKSINSIRSDKVKSLGQYYEAIEALRLQHFEVGSKAVSTISLSNYKEVAALCRQLQLDMDKLLSLKLTDKYLWCMEASSR